MTAPSSSPAAEPRKFGTFGGVFIPNVLTILGVIMFLRTGWVVGNAGLKEALLILVVANSITLLTTLSLSAIATNTKVGGGGAYFLISRSLGLEIGGSIGLPLFLAQAISVAFYIIAPVITMFFLTTYGTVNLVAGLERCVSNPGYRPTFKVHWLPSFLGAGGCLFVMILLNPLATVVAIACSGGIYWFLKRKQYQTSWGDVRSGLWFAVTRLGLLQFSSSRIHLRNWRPVMLVLVGNPKSRLPMVEFASHIEARRGLVFLAQIVVGDWQKLLPQQADWQQRLHSFIQENKLSAVAKTVLADDLEHGVSTLLQVAGIGSLEPNTVMIGWSDDELRQAVFVRTIHRILELKRNLLVFCEAELPVGNLDRRIDIWWRARENGSLMLTLAHLLKDAPVYRDHKIRVLRIIENEAGRENTLAAMGQIISDTRIEADVEIIVSKDAPLSVIGRSSELSAVCFIGLAVYPLKERDNPLASFSGVVGELKGNIFITKSWQELEY